MSYDILMATRRPPTRAMVEAFAAETGWRVRLRGDLAGEAGNLLVETAGLLRRRPLLTLSGPYPAEPEDLPAAVRRVVKGRALQCEANVVWSVLDTPDAARVFALCERLAVLCEGAVFNPQEDRLVFPDLPERPARRPSRSRARMLELEFHFPRFGVAEADAFLATLARVWPDSVPTRFGVYEPMKGKLAEPGGREAFVELSQGPDLLFWRSRGPALGGTLSRSPDREPPPGERPRVRLRLDFNASAIEGDGAACDRAVDLFSEVAGGLGAFFAAGYVLRDVLLGAGGAVWHDADTEGLGDWIRGPWWNGLPAPATWLSWYGGAYRAAVREALAGVAEERPGGLLVRLGQRPMDADQVLGLGPVIPQDLVVHLHADANEGIANVAGRKPRVFRGITPSDVIPDLTA